MTHSEDPQAPRWSTDPTDESTDPAHSHTDPVDSHTDSERPRTYFPAASATPAMPTSSAAPATTPATTSAPTTLMARERRADRRESIRANAAAIRRRSFTAGMWATRAPIWIWPALLLITAIGGVLRLFNLDFPHRLIFDETYYVKDGYSVFKYGYERSWPENADDSFNAGDPSVIESTPEYVVHPPLGKWIIGAGIHLFGADDSFGWRFSVAIVGTLTIFLMGFIAWKLFRSALFACVAAGLLSIDGEHFVHSRTSLLDIILMAFILLAFAFIVVDREFVTMRLARYTASTSPPDQTRDLQASRRKDLINFGHHLGVRPWLIAAGISLGLAMGVKWSGLYALAAFGILVVAWDVHSRHRAGVVHPWLGMLIRDSVPAFLKLVPVALLTYIVTWTGWIRSDDAWDRQWAFENSGWWSALPDWLQWLPSLAHYHYTAYSFHVGLDSEHPYMSNPWGWIVQWRPTSFYYESPDQGSMGCAVEHCSAAITSVGNPVIWGLAPIAILVALVAWIIRRDVRAGVILAGLAATWLPWFAYQERTIFTFYTIVMVPFVVLAFTYCLTLIWGRVPTPATATAISSTATSATSTPDAVPSFAPKPPGLLFAGRGTRIPWPLFGRRMAVGLILVAAIMAFAYFWPVYTGEVIPFEAWNNRMWNVTWR
ncbi:dolichyl-phosphate-mannose--protein mannosyltransferase [Brevibacterium aurantiacum]|uniref:Polyprenol-phosphate-mannose--protein mannosyltransferase n=1 Tax=Brevibacterium aurantiacum TaxID=273384 RepID=A0A3T0DH70_BREAU|nr:phospholipid carrier-dependent glycosyltransferase [Brevibacterium aurantiacum]AZT94457.1 phospholipid carrier-dependent glycosyltransferase [Brevibacterium aurantiacum]